MVRVLITDGSPPVRDAIRRNLECIGCQIVAEAATADQAVALLRTVKPQLVTLGIGIDYEGQPNPIELLRLIKRESPETSVLIVGEKRLGQDDRDFLGAGALACVFEPLDGANFDRLWHQLADAFPELRATGFAEMSSQCNARRASRI